MTSPTGQIGDVIKLLETYLTIAPEPFRSLVRKVLNDMKPFLEARPPRLALMGRRGSGKSSLVNAIVGRYVAKVGDVRPETGTCVWYQAENDRGALDILDTRGLGEAFRPESSSYATPQEEIMAALRQSCPDAILVLCKAKEVGGRLDEDLCEVQELRTQIQKLHGYLAPLIGVVTQVDELAPAGDRTPPFQTEAKAENIRTATALLQEKLQALAPGTEVIAVSAAIDWSEDAQQIEYDGRWQIDVLLNHLAEKLPDPAQVGLAQVSQLKTLQKRMARRVITVATAAAGGVGATPIPVADLPFITGIQVVMITCIGIIAGRRLDRKAVAEFIAACGVPLGAGLALREAVRALAKLIPVAGDAVAGAVAASGTYALGMAAMAYFIDGANPKDAYREAREQAAAAREG